MGDPTEKKAHTWARDALDWYVDPQRCTAQLMAVERFVGDVFDPCCGGGNIVRVLRAGGYQAWGSDLVHRRAMPSEWWRGERDFLAERYDYANIVMNPPYLRAKGTEAFIRRALEVAEGKVCVFVDRRFMTGAGRAKGLFRDHPPARAWEITPRPSCPPGEWLEAGNKAQGGTADYAWMVWDMTTASSGMVTGWLTEDHLDGGAQISGTGEAVGPGPAPQVIPALADDVREEAQESRPIAMTCDLLNPPAPGLSTAEDGF